MLPSQEGGQPVVRLGEIVMILDLHRQGLGVSAIARRTGFDRKTVRKVIAGGLEPPAYGPRQPKLTKLSRSRPICASEWLRFPNSPPDGCTANSALEAMKAAIPR